VPSISWARRSKTSAGNVYPLVPAAPIALSIVHVANLLRCSLVFRLQTSSDTSIIEARILSRRAKRLTAEVGLKPRGLRVHSQTQILDPCRAAFALPSSPDLARGFSASKGQSEPWL